MAKKKADTTIDVISKQAPAELIFSAQESRPPLPLPPGVTGAIRRQATSGLAPIIEFSDPGDYRVGTFVETKFSDATGTSAKIKSPLYMLMVEPDAREPKAKPLLAGLWGSTILDSRMRTINPTPGMRLLIRYMGDVPTSRGLTPAKDWDVIELEPAAN